MGQNSIINVIQLQWPTFKVWWLHMRHFSQIPHRSAMHCTGIYVGWLLRPAQFAEVHRFNGSVELRIWFHPFPRQFLRCSKHFMRPTWWATPAGQAASVLQCLTNIAAISSWKVQVPSSVGAAPRRIIPICPSHEERVISSRKCCEHQPPLHLRGLCWVSGCCWG